MSNNITRTINLLIVVALLGSAGNLHALSRATPHAKPAAADTITSPEKEIGGPGRLRRLRNWFGEEVFNRKKLKRNAKYAGGAMSAAALVTLLYALANRTRVAENRAGWGTDGIAKYADATAGRLARFARRKPEWDLFGHRARMEMLNRQYDIHEVREGFTTAATTSTDGWGDADIPDLDLDVPPTTPTRATAAVPAVSPSQYSMGGGPAALPGPAGSPNRGPIHSAEAL